MTKVLVLHKGGIGDVVFALPLFEDLKRAFPSAELTVLTHDQGQELLAFAPFVDHALALGPVARGWKLGRALERIRGRSFDIALTTARSPRAAYFLWKSGARTRVGFSGGPEALLYTHRAPTEPVEKVFSRRFERLETALGLTPSQAMPRLEVPPIARARGRALLEAQGWSGNGPLIAIHIGGGWPTKRWPTEYVVSLANILRDSYQATLLLQGGADDLARASEIERDASRGSVVSSVGAAIRDALSQAALCSAAVGVDSGLSHATAALGVPTLHLFGPNDPDSIRWSEHQQVLTLKLPCQPCNRAGKKRCPLGTHQCMRDLYPQRVAIALAPLLHPVPRAVAPT